MPSAKAIAEQRHPWDRQEGESSPAHLAFQVYLELGSERSLNAAYSSRGQKGGKEVARRKAPGIWQRWSKSHDWPARAAEWDAHLAKRVREGFADALRDSATEMGAATIREYYAELRKIKTLANDILGCTKARVSAAKAWPRNDLHGDAATMRIAAETLGLTNRDLLAILGHPQLFALLSDYGDAQKKLAAPKG